MTYKIKNKITNEYLNFIKFDLDGYVEFSDGKQKFIYCVNEHPFTSYQKGDKIEIDLTNVKHVSAYAFIDSRQEIVKKVSGTFGNYLWWQHDNSSLQQDEEKSRQEQFQAQEQLTLFVSAYDKKVAYKLFRNSLEWAEKYADVVYPDYQIKKQIHDNNIKRQDANDQNRVKRLFSSVLFGFKSTMEIINGDKRSKQSLYDEIKKEYYEWLGATGINPSNCPTEFKHFLFEINEILEGRGDKLERDIENRKWEIDPNSAEYEQAFNSLFTNVQIPLDNERNEYENLKGKTQKDIKITNNFGGNSEPAEQVFKQMAGQHDYQGFSFVPQKDIQTNSQVKSSSSFQQRPNSVIVRNVEQNPRDWRFDKVIINGERKIALVHHSVQEEKIDLDSQPVYLPEKFSSEEIERVNKVLGISSQSSSSPTCSSTKQLINQKLVNNIKQNAKLERRLFVINQETGERSENEDWFIHNSLERKIDDKTGYLIFNSEAMVRAKDLNKLEQKAVGYKSEVSLQNDSFTSAPKTQKDNKFVTSGILTIIGVVSVVVIASVVIVKKQLNKKIKK